MLHIVFLSCQVALSQSHISKNNYTGAYETQSSWSPTWTTPNTNIMGGDSITINGYITVNGSLSFSILQSDLIINDTLVIKGDLFLGNLNTLIIREEGVLIVRGNLIICNFTNIESNGYFIITGNISEFLSNHEGSFKSNDDPVKVFIGGAISSSELCNNLPNYPVLNCTAPATARYLNSNCSYGNMTDILTDPIYPFFQSICPIATPVITPSGPVTFCTGGNVTLTSSSGLTYLWSNGATTQSNNVTSPGNYSVRVTNASGCQSATSAATVVTVNALPATPTITAGGPATFCAGGSVTLTSSTGTSYLWSNGATTRSINVTSTGSYTVRVSNSNGCQSAASSPTNVTVNALPTTPTITAGGPTTFCAGGSVTLTSSTGTSYLWSNGATTRSINVTTGGNYTVRVTNASGCQSAASVATVVTVNALPATPTITAGGPTGICAGASLTLTSSAGSTYLWSTGATSASINVTTAGSFTVRVTNASGCQSAASAATVVTVNALPATPTITAGGPRTFCAGGSVTLTSSTGTSYLWSNGATTRSINVTSTGSYTVRVSNSNGCQSAASSPTNVTVNALPTTPTITAGGPTTFCAGGSVTLTSSTGTSYLWSNGATTRSINVTTGGNYTVRVTNASGCQSAASVATVVTVNALPATPTITAGGPTGICAGASLTLTSSAGSTYLWSTGATSASINVTTAGSFTVRVTNASGCQSAASAATVVTVNALPATPTITAGGPRTFCAGGSVTLTSSTGTSYLWSNGATTRSINVISTGSYTVRVSNSNGCQSAASSPTNVTVNALPTTPTITAGGPTTFCAGGSVTLTSSTGTSYLWSNGATTRSINVTTGGNYTVRVTNASGCQSAASVTTVVTVNALPATPTITAGGPKTFCAGGNVTLTSSSGPSYLWSNTETSSDINVSSAGSYSVMVIDTNGCQSAASIATVVNINALPVVNAGTDATIPNGTSTTINATITGTGPFTYTWSPSAQLVNALTEDPTTINLSSTTLFTLKATSVTTSCFNSDAVTISVSGGALSSTPTVSPVIICAGDNIQLNAVASGGSGSYTYTWTSTPAGFTSSVAAPTANPTVNTTYNVAVFDGFNTVNSQVSLTVNNLPVIPTISAGGPTTICTGSSVSLTSSTGTSYLWSTGATTQSINVTNGGNYSVRVTNAAGCQSAPSVATLVTVNPKPAKPTVTAGGPTTFCEGDSVTLTSSAGTTYLWSNGATTQSIFVTAGGIYTVRVANSNGCQSNASNATEVTVNVLPPIPDILASGPATFCSGGSLTLTADTGSSYLWSTGATTPSINVTIGGSYTVIVTNAAGCHSAPSGATIVTVNALPATPVITAGGPTTFCAGDSVTLTSSAGASYLWSNGATSQSIHATYPGNYTVQVTNASGCQSAPSAATAVTVNALPANPSITYSGSTTFCDGDSVTLTSIAGTSYLWSTGATTQSINVDTAGNYTVIVANAIGCWSSASIPTIVTVNAIPATPTITASGQTTFCAGGNVILTSSAGTSYLWSNGETTSNINVTATGNYSVQLTNASGCQSSVSAVTLVTVNPLPATPTITAVGPTTFCAGEIITLTSDAGTSYLWSTGDTTAAINVSTSGNYFVSTINAGGCQSARSEPTLITVNAIPETPIISADGPTAFCAGGSVTLYSSAGSTYQWSNGATTPAINVRLAGTYYVQVANDEGCQSAPSVVTIATVFPKPDVDITGCQVVCSGSIITLSGNPSGGTPFYLHEWDVSTPGLINLVNKNDGSATITATGNGIATLTYTVTDSYGCTTSDSFDIGVNQQAGVIRISTGAPSSVISPAIASRWKGFTSAGTNAALYLGYSSLDAAGDRSELGSINYLHPGNNAISFIYDKGADRLTAAINGSPLIYNNIGSRVNLFSSGAANVSEMNYLMVNMGNSLTGSISLNNLILNGVSLNPFIGSGSNYNNNWTITGIDFSEGFTLTGTITLDAGLYGNNEASKVEFSLGEMIDFTCISVDSSVCSGESATVNLSGLIKNRVYSATYSINGSALVTSPSFTADINGNGIFQTVSLINSTTVPVIQTVAITTLNCENATLHVNCNNAKNVVVNSTIPVGVSISASANPICEGDSITFKAIPTNGGSTPSYTWRINGANAGTNSSTYTYTPANNDNVICVLTSSHTICVKGNPAYSNTLIMAVNSMPSGSITLTDNSGVENNDGIICDGDVSTITASGGITYLWSSGETTASIVTGIAGTYTVTFTSTEGCSNTNSATITVNSLPVINISSSSGSMCENDLRTLTASPEGGIFNISDGPGMITGNVLTATSSGKINLEYVYTEVCTSKATQSIIADEHVTSNAGSDLELEYIFETQMEAELPQNGNGEWSLVSGSGNISDINSPITRITELSIGANKFLWSVINGGCKATDDVVITVKDIVTPTVITPNEDGLNDALIFPGLIAFPGSAIHIYNRWGSEIYSNTDYRNDWKGKDNKNRDIQEDTYYYVLSMSNGRIVKGFIEIMR